MQRESEERPQVPKIPYFPDEVRHSSVEILSETPEEAMENALKRLRERAPNNPWTPSMEELIAFRAKLAELKKLPPNAESPVTTATPVIEPYSPVVPDRNSTSPPSIGCFWQDVSPYGPPIRACPVE